MLLRLKLRIGALLIVAGGLLAAVGELVNLWNTNPSSSNWFVCMGLVVLGVLVCIYGITMYAQLSDTINFLGLIGSGLLFLGGLLSIVGSIAINMLVLPMLLGLATAIAAVVNAPGAAAQTAANIAASGINAATSGVAGLFGQSSSSASIPSVTVPGINGLDIVNKMLTGLHLPSFTQISLWGHVFSSGGPLTVGCLVLGFALLRAKSFPMITCLLLMAAAVLNLVSQCFISVFPIAATFTGVLLFVALAWLGASVLLPEIIGKISIELPFQTHAEQTN